MKGLSRVAAVLSLSWSHLALAASLPPGFSETNAASGLSSPTAMAVAPDGRLFVCEQGGQLRVIKNDALLSTPFLSLTVDSSGERGLLGVAFDPAFAANGFVYVYYTVTTPTTHNRVSRFVASGDVFTGTETVLFDLDDLSIATNHNGGGIHFGLDGKLYIGVGENANGANSQTLANLLGKLLRINSDGSIPADNPFFLTASGKNRAIWALGLRNPFTFAFQRGTGLLFINDVGQSTWEEINQGAAGANYGWPTTEGVTTDPRFVSPIFVYGHGTGSTVGCAIVGAAFYNPPGVQFPAGHLGSYFFADLCSGWIRRLDTSAGNVVSDFASGIATPVDLAVSADGSLYYLARGGGIVNRIRFTESPPPAKADLSGDSRADVVWRNPSTGQNAVWVMNGTTFGSIVDLPGLPNANYQIVGTGDFDSDGQPDLLLRNGVTGRNAVWLMNGTSLKAVVDLPSLPNTAYRVGGVGDFNGDGFPDILWRNASTGQNAVWLMHGTTMAAIVDLQGLPNANYQMQGSADFNGDGKADILWRNVMTGQNAVWLMNRTSLLSVMDLPALPNLSYRIGGIADYDADGHPDLVWRNFVTGQNAIWVMNGASLSSIVDLPSLANLNYEISGPR